MNLGNRNSQHSFSKVPQVNMARSKFDRSFAVKDTFDFDYLVPIFCDEILPGDTVNLNVKSFARLATQVVPLLDNMYTDYFFFFVPNRLLWDNWQKFMGAQVDPGDSIDYILPYITSTPTTGFAVGSIYDKFGIPTQVPDLEICSLPFRAYNLIWNEWFRDQNLQDSLIVPKGDSDSATNYTLQKRAKKHDYFTSGLPWPQKGDPISFPLAGTAPVVSDGTAPVMLGLTSNAWGTLNTTVAGDVILAAPSSGTVANEALSFRLGQTGLETDLSAATAATVNQLRQSIMLQSLLELDARGGTRYVEIVKAHFNVTLPDFTAQRPEFLSGGTVRIVQHPVTQTSESGETPLATLAAFSTAANMGNNIGFTKSFVEHGYVIGLIQARGDVTYQQGLHKMWSRKTKHDIFWPKFQELGEQATLMKEIYATGNPTNDNAVHSYQERYAEYRYSPSQIRGQFRSNFAETLDVWHLAEEFSSAPLLNAEFIESNTPIERSLVVAEGYPHLLYDAWFQYTHARPMVSYGVPATLGRF